MQIESVAISDLPAPVAGYFASHTTDPDALARCFTDDAVVVDEGHEHRGRPAIAAWNAAANAKYAISTQVLGAATDAQTSTVLAKVTGSFPGSGIELRFHFELTGKLISRLEIAP